MKPCGTVSPAAFDALLGSGIGGIVTSLGLAVFAYSTLIGWSYYGEIATEYLFGISIVRYYRLAFVVFIFIGAVMELETVWVFADVMNALMALPNLTALVLLSSETVLVHHEKLR